MRELYESKSWHKAPILALLAAGLVTGGAWEMMANADRGIPQSPDAVVEPENPLQGRTTAEAVVIQPPTGELTPPPEEKVDVSAAPTFTPFTVAPSILNRGEVVRAMEAAYPKLLRDAGIGGTARLYFFIDAQGTVQDIRLDQSSGHQALDEAAMSVARVFRFSPALNRDEPVPVWVNFPITFQLR